MLKLKSNRSWKKLSRFTAKRENKIRNDINNLNTVIIINHTKLHFIFFISNEFCQFYK